MAYQNRGEGMRKRGGIHRRKKVCVFCGEENGVISPAPAQSIRES